MRTRGDTASSVTAIRREVQSIDPEQAVLGIRTLEQNLEGAFNEPRTMVTVFGGFAPLTVTWLIATTGNKLMPAFYIIAAGVLSIVVVGTTLGGVQRRAAAERS